MKYYLWLIWFFALVGITWAGMPSGPEQSLPPQEMLAPIDDGLTIAQIFYYVAGGGAAVAVAVKTWLTVYRRWKNKRV
jgi:hypothetical protein